MVRVVVLAVSYDPLILETHRQVLQSASYTVTSVREGGKEPLRALPP